MTLQQLQYFQTVAVTQHYRIAAEKLNITQPTLSHAISNLEQEIGLYLFEKQGRNVILTKSGHVFLEHVNTILKDVDIAERKMQQLVSASAGHIDIGYVSPLAKYYIPKLLKSFLSNEENAHVTFSLKQNFTPQLIAGLKRNQFDVVFCSHIQKIPDLVFVSVASQEIVTIVPNSHPLAKEESVSLDEFRRYPLIAYNLESGLGKYTRELFASHKIAPAIFCESSDEYSIAAMVEEGFGIALAADCHGINQANVKKLPIKDTPLIHTVYMIYNQNRYQTPAVKNFINYTAAMKIEV